MNVSQISQNLGAIWIYFVIAIPLTVLSFIVVGNWASLVKAWSYLFKIRKYDYSVTKSTRWKKMVTAIFYHTWSEFHTLLQNFQAWFRRILN
jgi:hypothetical protein